jgi:N-acetylmuramoyl-L-alanine amidase
MINRGFLIGLLAAASLVPAVRAAHVRPAVHVDVRAVAVTASSDEAAGVSIDLSRATTYNLFTLANPSRVVIDLRDARLASTAHLPPGAGILVGIRAAPRPNGGLRVVMQLNTGAPAAAEWAAPTARGGATQLLVSIGRPADLAQLAAPRAIHAAHAPAADSDRDVVVAVDAGHGGQDPGAIGHAGTHEKDVVLAIARALAERINTEPGMHAILTRDRDEFLLLRERIHRARLAKADLFVSVHADSIANRDVSGSSVYVLSEHGATDEAARWLAERQNAADLMGGVSLSDKDSTLASVLLDLSQSANISASMTAAEGVLGALERVGEVRKPQVQQAGFVVLKSPDIPSMLVETAYISNPAEERRLKSAPHQAKIANAIFAGLKDYFERNPPSGTHFARDHAPGPTTVLAGAAAAASISER